MNEILDAPASIDQQSKYAGFWIRVAASFIDAIIVGFVNGMISFGFLRTAGLQDMSNIIAYYLISLGLGIAYHTIMESSEKQATIGKMAVGIKVGDLNGERISFINALGRYFSKVILCTLTLGIGYMMAGWDDKKQGLHDKLANTYVYYG
jgi:uncharacterized RDD family membrane protein YckC